MPFLNDEELASLNKLVFDTKDELTNSKKELKHTQYLLEEQEEELKSSLKSKKKQNIILSILAGLCLALACYFYNSGSSNVSNININEIKKIEANRLLDSIQNSNALNNTNTTDNNIVSSDTSIETLKNNINGEKIYSVQIGAFSDSQYTLLSETLAGISSNGDMFKYSIGLFKTLQEAQDFRKELVKIGFKDAFVASYIDGIRKEIEQPN